MVIHWAGENSQVIMALTKDVPPRANSSKVYLSRDYGVSFTEIQDSLMKISSSQSSVLDKFYNSPVYNSHVSASPVYNSHVSASPIYNSHVSASPIYNSHVSAIAPYTTVT